MAVFDDSGSGYGNLSLFESLHCNDVYLADKVFRWLVTSLEALSFFLFYRDGSQNLLEYFYKVFYFYSD